MVKLNKIYTRTGDGGETGLGDGTRLAKHAPRVTAYGEVDEANAAIGVAVAALSAGGQQDAIADTLRRVQNDLFDLGADLCVPEKDNEESGAHLRITTGQVEALEQDIDRMNAGLEPLTSFVLPGGTAASAHLHLARTIVRRAERAITRLAETDSVSAPAVGYINRLSDLLFVMARLTNENEAGDVLWRPGGDR